jgi:branched-chain amino acid transport system permease protein
MGLAGLLLLHAPIWRARRVGRLVGPYLLTGALGLVAVAGVIGLLEMVHFVAVSEGAGTTKRLFWVAVAPRTLTPWLAFAALVVAGALGLRWAGPRAAAAFNEASR